MSLNLFFCSRFLVALHLFGMFTVNLCAAASEPEDPGMIAMNAGQYDEAYQYYLSQASQPESKDSALFYLAQLSLAKGDADTARKHIV